MTKKYKLSLSAVISILVKTTYYCLLHYQLGENQNQFLQETYIYTEKGIKTTVKPKCFTDDSIYTKAITNKICYMTNAVRLYTEKDFKKYVNKEGVSTYYNKINEGLQKEKDNFYNYNQYIRNRARYKKEIDH